MKMGFVLWVGVVVGVSSACAQESGVSPSSTQVALAPVTEDVLNAAASITPSDYLRKISVIAHDSMGGRDTPSPGLEMTAAWIAGEFRRLGLTPGGDEGGFLQRYVLPLVEPEGAAPSEPGTAPNVVGILEGSDPQLNGEFIVFSAHMDHIGIGPPDADGDSINNGADDDASGTTAILELAEAFAGMAVKPKRSIIFLTVSGEEKGLWGSEYFANNPPVPVDRMVANLNADMIGRNWSDTIVVIGKEHSDLGTTMNQVNAVHPELDMTAIDDIWPDQRFYFRSDHFNFAKKGVPVLFFFNGTHEDYHGGNDEVDRIDTDKASRITKLMFFLGYELAERAARPQWYPESRSQIVSDEGV